MTHPETGCEPLILLYNADTAYDEFKFPEFKEYLKIAQCLLGLF